MTTFKEWAKVEIAKLGNMSKEQMIEHFPHKAQANLFEMWKQEVNGYQREREREREDQAVTKGDYSKWKPVLTAPARKNTGSAATNATRKDKERKTGSGSLFT